MSMIKSLGHLLLAAMFIWGGAHAVAEPGERVQQVEKAGIPNARAATILNGMIMVTAGSALALEIAPTLAALACETPTASDRPVSSWTPRELADEAVKRGIVEQISPRTVERF